MSKPSNAVRANTAALWPLIVTAGVIAAMHVWKLPGALEMIRTELNMSLVAAGMLLGIVQVGSMALGLLVSLFSEVIGIRRTLIIGLALLAASSLIGAVSPNAAVLLVTRAFEGIGFLMATVVAPALIRHNTEFSRVNIALGWWSAYQGAAAFLAILASTLLLTQLNWRIWWTIMAVLTVAIIPVVLARIPADTPAPGGNSRRDGVRLAIARIGRTVRTLPPWGMAVVFSCYTLQWGAVVGFLPTIFAEKGVATLLAGVATAAVAGANGAGNVLVGLLLHRRVPLRGLVLASLLTMGGTTALFFAVDWDAVWGGTVWQVLIAALFSFGGAAIPTCMMRIAVDVAPADGSPAAVLGLMMQIYNGANFVGPIVLAAIAAAAGGWQLSWTVTVSASALGIVVALVLLRGRVLGALSQ